MTSDYVCPLSYCQEDQGAKDVLYFHLTFDHLLSYEATSKAMGSTPLFYNHRGSQEKR